MAQDTSCLHSVVRNISGVDDKFFAFLPPHGARLDDDEQMSIFGDIREAVNRGDRSGNRNMLALEAAIRDGLLEISYTPAPILEDPDSEDVKMLVLAGDVLALADPCWEFEEGSISDTDPV